MDSKTFRKEAHRLVDWMADYFDNIEEYPVKPTVKPGDTLQQLPPEAPQKGDSFDDIFDDFKKIIIPGMTHWESPNFMGYFPANKSYPSVLAEMLTATLGAQCMSWITSPAATELEERMMEWLRNMLHLPDTFTGVIEDTASTSTLCALLMARERATGFNINENGFGEKQLLTVYCSTQTHSSIEKDVKIAGYGRANLRKIPVDDVFAMKAKTLEEAIRSDLQAGFTPACVIATLGTTGSTAIDPLEPIADICKKYDVFLHVDAAFAGTALILPEFKWMSKGIEKTDSFVFNPHKWMFTNFDCSAFFVKDENLLVRTFEIMPEYLRTAEDQCVRNYRDWGIQLGRRFRALKLWFVIRSFGLEGLKKKIRLHLSLASELKTTIKSCPDFELVAPLSLNTICFRYKPSTISDENILNQLNSKLLEYIQKSEKLFITHTKLNEKFTLRIVIGNTNVTKRHVDKAWKLITETADKLIK